jgi:hypothetical protein
MERGMELMETRVQVFPTRGGSLYDRQNTALTKFLKLISLSKITAAKVEKIRNFLPW